MGYIEPYMKDRFVKQRDPSVKTVLPLETSVLEEQCGQYTAIFSSCLPNNMKAIAFCTPASFRDPEVDEIWHPTAYSRGAIRTFVYQVKECVRAVISGCKKLVLGRFGSATLVVRSGSTKLSFGTELVCSIGVAGEVSTEYLSEQDQNDSHWLVVSSNGNESTMSRSDILVLGSKFFLAWVRASIIARRSSIDLIATVQVFRWIVSLAWAPQWTWLRADRKSTRLNSSHW